MSYLFQVHIEPALKVELTAGNAKYLKQLSEKKTSDLTAANGRVFNRHDDFQVARDLVASMGDQFKPATGDWAGNYVTEWRMVSGNVGTIRSMVSRELDAAYQIGLDIRATKVLGEMFNLAVQVWSTVGEYSSPSQSEGRR